MGQSRDFGEIPSNMLEHFIWIPDVMVRLSKHYTKLPAYSQSTGQVAGGDAIPLPLAQAVARTKTLNQATGLIYLMLPALYDLAIYTPKSHTDTVEMDTTAVWDEISSRYLPYEHCVGEGLAGQASFSLFSEALMSATLSMSCKYLHSNTLGDQVLI